MKLAYAKSILNLLDLNPVKHKSLLVDISNLSILELATTHKEVYILARYNRVWSVPD